MAQKRGKGGYGSENYDPETGRYVKDDKNQYHAGANISVNDLISLLKQGYFDEPDLNEEGMYSSLFAGDKDEELDEDEELWEAKSNLISALQEALDQENTRQALLNTNFPEISSSEFAKYAKECKDLTSVQDRAAFNNDYKGAGDICFEFNKALRFGFQKYYQLYPQYKNSPYLNPAAITDRAKKLDNLTSSWEFPEDKKVFRLLDSAPLLSWFGQTGIFDGLKTFKNQYNYDMLEPGYDKQDLVNRLNSLVGTKVPPDGSFTSFSCLTNNSHMKKNKERDIMIRFNARKGTKAWISDYEYESEGLFNRTTGFVVQGASLEKIYGKEYVVLEYGIQ